MTPNPNEKIKVGLSCPGIGDSLAITPIFKHFKCATLELIEHHKSHKIAPLFDGLCEVVFSQNPCGIKSSINPHISKRLTEAYGIDDIVSCIPQIKITDMELKSARSSLENVANPIAFIADTDGSGEENNPSKYRVLPKEYLQNLINKYSETHTVIQFGISKNLTKFDNIIQMPDLKLRHLAAHYMAIGKYFGIDTGDYHLMLAVGGSCDVHCPPSGHGYNHAMWHYNKEFWKNEDCRVKYTVYQ